ncbi:hypothetical protein [Streptomyces phytophilus]|uniref:hypothetical protein n=1 Tax=Streptomyces phytophilus TaxID=722715 RepID=UPI00215DAA5F|nr:hypothetical protein [Streptomyces phytophilus]
MKRTAARLTAGLMIAGAALGVSAGTAMAEENDWNVSPQELDWGVAPQENDWNVTPWRTSGADALALRQPG